MAVWVVRAGRDSEIIEEVENRGVVAIGWTEMGDLSDLQARADFKARYEDAYPDDTSAARIGLQSGQVYRFAREIEVGDTVLTPDSPAREVLIGEVVGEYEYDPSLINGYPHVRHVNWLKTISRDEMSNQLRGATGGIMTVFRLDGFEDEVTRLLKGEPEPSEEGGEPEEQVSFYEDTVAKADELISDILAGIGPYEFQDLVAALLRAMGLRTEVSPPGPDGGKDIVAHPDAFGFEQPCIKVQVKHTKGSIGAPDVRNFRSVIGPDEKGLFISTGGFTNEALHEPERAGQPLTLMDRDQFVDLLTEHYDSLEPEYQAMVPLKKVYIPVTVG